MARKAQRGGSTMETAEGGLARNRPQSGLSSRYRFWPRRCQLELDQLVFFLFFFFFFTVKLIFSPFFYSSSFSLFLFTPLFTRSLRDKQMIEPARVNELCANQFRFFAWWGWYYVYQGRLKHIFSLLSFFLLFRGCNLRREKFKYFRNIAFSRVISSSG